MVSEPIFELIQKSIRTISISHKSSIDETTSHEAEDLQTKKFFDPNNNWIKNNVDFQALRATQT